MARTPQTELEYERIARRHLERARRRVGDLSPTDLARWSSAPSPHIAAILSCAIDDMQDRAQQVRRKTAQLWRAAMAFKIKALHVQLGDVTLAALLVEVGRIRPARRGAPLQPRTSSARPKSIPPQHLEALVAHLCAADSLYGPATADFLCAGVITGLRPCEWQQAELHWLEAAEIPTAKLLARNAKATNGRGGAGCRALLLDQENATLVARHLATVAKHRDDFNTFCGTCRSRLRRARKALWGVNAPPYSLYTGRHQFAANAKASDASRRDVANLLGHTSENTAGRHYGKKRSGQPTLSLAQTAPGADDQPDEPSATQELSEGYPADR